MKKLMIVGGGAAAFLAAVHAANNGLDVTILEKGNKPLKKFAMTGNGKCNLTNLYKYADSFRSHDQSKVQSLVDGFDCSDVRNFFEGIGLPSFDKNGWVYPRCESAKNAAFLLEAAAKRADVKIKTMQDVTDVFYDGNNVKVLTSGWKYDCDLCIIACGTDASVVYGSSELIENICRNFSLERFPYLPALSGIPCRDERMKSWPKVRAKAAITVFVDGKPVNSKRGELQFSSDSVSGIAAMQVSRYIEEALYNQKRCSAVIDLAPDMTEEELARYLQALLDNGITLQEALLGLLPQGLADTFAEETPEKTSRSIKNFTIDSFIPGNVKNAQVCQGGIALSSLDDTLKVPGAPVWICGEMLDVEGDCGGYNLQWAFSSAYTAAQAAAGLR